MTFERTHKLVIYGLVILGLLPLALSGEIPFPIVLATYGAIGASFFAAVPRQRHERHARWWTLGILAAAVLLGLGAWATGRWLLNAILFALIMVVVRLWQSRSSRDVFQLYALTFVALIAGAVVNPTPSFLLSFLGYVVLLVWGLVLLHLQRDLEAVEAEHRALGELAPDQGWKARGLVTPRFLMGTSALAVGIFAFSGAFFFFFPRLGMGFFFGQGRSGQSISGFSDKMELGHFGTIKDNMDVVMRVEFPDDPNNRGRRLRMRGISFDHYDGRVWAKTTQRGTFQMIRQREGVWRLQHALRASRDRALGERVAQRVYLEPLQVARRMIFGQPRMLSVAIDNPGLDRLKRDRTVFHQDVATDVSTRGRTDTALRYTVVSAVERPDVDALRRSDGGEIPEWVSELYLQVPETLDPRIADLARQVTADKKTTYDKVHAVERYLTRKLSYSTEGGHDRANPLGDFLFKRRAGHCEYFASAMTLMLRTLGIPARPANGFYGSAWNDYGGYYAVRQADAHSWVEVYYPDAGWLTYDPTPTASVLVPPSEGLWASVQEWVDSLKLQWYKWVVEYDLEKQIAFFREIGRTLKDVLPSPEGGQGVSAWKRGIKKWLESPSTWAMIGLPLLLLWLLRSGRLVRALRWLWRRRRREPQVADRGAVSRIYEGMLRAVERQGVRRRATETPRELSARLAARGHGAAREVDAITAAFEQVRYADRALPAERLPELEQALAAVRAVKAPRPS